jgi:hypothetical protein
MKVSIIDVGVVSSIIFLAFASRAQALPSWLKPRGADLQNAARRYYGYGPPAGGYGAPPPHYTYGGYGPQPTLTPSQSSSISASSIDSGDLTSSSTSKKTSGKSQSIYPAIIVTIPS